MSTDLHPNPRLEARLRDTFDTVIPHLMDADVDIETRHADVDEGLRLETGEEVGPARRSGLLGIAAALLLVAGGAAFWSTTQRAEPSTIDPATSPSVATTTATSVASPPMAVASPMSTILAAPTESSVPCLVEGCTPVDQLPVVDGAFDFSAGPESLGTPVIHQEWIDQFGLVRCLELTSDGTACQRIEGLAGVGLVEYPSIGVEIGTTFTSISAAAYAALWGESGAGPAPTEDVTVRGHAGVRFPYGERQYVVWQEREGTLVWVTAPTAIADELMSIAEGIRTLDGPTTIPYLVVTGLGEPWDAEDNDADGVVYARIGDALCLGIGWVPDPCSRIVTRRDPDQPGMVSIAGAGPIGATAARVDVAGGESLTFETVVENGLPDARLFLGEVPAGATTFTLTWLASDGTTLAAEVLDLDIADTAIADTAIADTDIADTAIVEATTPPA